MPVTIPDPEPILATAMLLLDQIPPDVLLVNEVLNETHRLEGPDIAPTTGSGLTVNIFVATTLHP
jgi:hypothetical protein